MRITYLLETSKSAPCAAHKLHWHENPSSCSRENSRVYKERQLHESSGKEGWYGGIYHDAMCFAYMLLYSVRKLRTRSWPSVYMSSYRIEVGLYLLPSSMV